MMRKLCVLVAALALGLVPGTALADVDIVQDSCNGFIDGNNQVIEASFTLVNFSLPVAVCDLHLIPEPTPVEPQCEVVLCSTPPGWSCFLNPLGGADYFANTPGDCIPPGTQKSGFDIRIVQPLGTARFCCYIAQFTDATGAVITEEEVCFCTNPLDTEPSSWGLLKAKYR